MTKMQLRIGTFVIDDAELTTGQQGQTLLRIPCASDPDLCKQLDAWDEQTSIPALIEGTTRTFYRHHYDHNTDAWLLSAT